MRTRSIVAAPDPADLDAIGLADLADALRDLDRFRAELATRTAKVRELKDSRHQAAQDDLKASAKAARDGKPDPGPRITKALDVRIAQVQYQADTYQVLVAEQDAKVLAILDANATAYAATVAAVEAVARAALVASLAPARQAVARMEAANNLRNFLAEAADPDVTRLRVRRTALHVDGLPRSNGDGYAARTILDRLEVLGEPPVIPGQPADAPVQPLGPRPQVSGVYVGRG